MLPANTEIITWPKLGENAIEKIGPMEIGRLAKPHCNPLPPNNSQLGGEKAEETNVVWKYLSFIGPERKDSIIFKKDNNSGLSLFIVESDGVSND